MVYGSAGDLFPLVPIIERLRANGCEVAGAVPRPLGFHLRSLGIPVFHLGRGAEIEALRNARIVSRRFDGWESVRRLADHYSERTLATDVALMEELIDTWSPDLVLTSTLAASGRIAAHRRQVRYLEVSIYPQLLARMRSARRFATAYRAMCSELAGLGGTDPTSDLVGELAWGIRRDTVQLHDPALLRHGGIVEPNAVGYSYWDDAMRSSEDMAAVERWFRQSSAPAVAVTMGSYLGVARETVWAETIATLAGLGVRGLFLGPRRRLERMFAETHGDWLAVGYVPLSRLLENVHAVIHHGGLGTTFAALHAGRPAVVVPTAFDQPFNARLVANAGAGLIADVGRIAPALAAAIGDPELAKRAEAVASRLAPAELAVERAVDRILVHEQE